jgi:hypothetical protein
MEDNKMFEKLTMLQDCLIQKFNLEDEIDKLPKDLLVKQELLGKINKEYTEENSKTQLAKDELKSLRIQYEDMVTMRENSEKKMELITTQREFEALEKEIKDASEKEQMLLKQLHAKEQQVQEMDAQLTEKESLLKLQQREVGTESSKIEGLMADKKAQCADVEKQCLAFIDGDINQDLYDKFSVIVKNKHGKGIVPIHGLVCQGCHIMLPIQFVNDVRVAKKISFCPYCSRILYYEDVEGAEEQFKKPVRGDEEEVETEESGAELSDFTEEDEFNDIV